MLSQSTIPFATILIFLIVVIRTCPIKPERIRKESRKIFLAYFRFILDAFLEVRPGRSTHRIEFVRMLTVLND